MFGCRAQDLVHDAWLIESSHKLVEPFLEFLKHLGILKRLGVTKRLSLSFHGHLRQLPHGHNHTPGKARSSQTTNTRRVPQFVFSRQLIKPMLRRTPEGNPDFDLYEADSNGQPIRWVEVKSMTGSLEDRPVGLSHTQFDCALEKGEAYWLYVVEHATGQSQARILKIQNPAGLARTFTFDSGWRGIARIDLPR